MKGERGLSLRDIKDTNHVKLRANKKTALSFTDQKFLTLIQYSKCFWPRSFSGRSCFILKYSQILATEQQSQSQKRRVDAVLRVCCPPPCDTHPAWLAAAARLWTSTLRLSTIIIVGQHRGFTSTQRSCHLAGAEETKKRRTRHCFIK